MAEETEIPREEWSDFFDHLGLQYEGWRATVETIDVTDDEEEIETREVVIESMSAELEEGEDTIALSFAGDSPLTILNPTRVSMEETEEGRDTLLEVETELGMVRLWFRFPTDTEGQEVDTEEW